MDVLGSKLFDSFISKIGRFGSHQTIPSAAFLCYIELNWIKSKLVQLSLPIVNNSHCDIVSHEVLVGHKMAVLIDAGTSRLKVNSAYIDICKEVLTETAVTRFCIAIMIGPRLDLMDPIMKRCQIFRARTVLIQLTSGTTQRKSRSLPSFMVLVHSDSSIPLPWSVELLKFRSESVEQPRLRCMTKNCIFRTPAEKALLVSILSLDSLFFDSPLSRFGFTFVLGEGCSLLHVFGFLVSQINEESCVVWSHWGDESGPHDTAQELNKSDCEDDQWAVFNEAEEGGQEDAMECDGLGVDEENTPRDFLIDLWPYARPVRCLSS